VWTSTGGNRCAACRHVTSNANCHIKYVCWYYVQGRDMYELRFLLAMNIKLCLLPDCTLVDSLSATDTAVTYRTVGTGSVGSLDPHVVTLRPSAGEISLSRLPAASSSFSSSSSSLFSSSSSLAAFPFSLLRHSSLPSTNPRTGRLQSVRIFDVFSYSSQSTSWPSHIPHLFCQLHKDAVGGLLTAH